MAKAQRTLKDIWESTPGLPTYFATVDHKKIGIRYIVTAFMLFVAAGFEALFMRTQLARPDNTFLDPETYDQLFTMHGTTMIFLFATPILFGFGNFLVPLMIGARDMAYPRINALGYWIFLFAGLFLYSSFLIGMAPDGGWFSYVPLTGPAYSPGLNLDFWTLGILFLGIGTTMGAINFIVTIFRMRAPGMTIGRMPVFIWAILVTSFAVVFAMPSLNAANVFLELERRLGLPFYDPAGGGNPLLWQHLFWIFGHPDVYIIVLPALGMVSEIVPAFSRRPLIGYTLVVVATVATGIIGFGVWVHHMFATGLPPLVTGFFSAASFIITIPSGIQIFAWLSTILSGRPSLKTPLLFVAGFLILFVMGGLTGVMFPLVGFDRQVTDSYFVVAHFHYVLFGGMVFPLFAGFYYWFPKMTGRMLGERLGAWNFWLMFIGFNVTFFPMHIAGLLGMPRRIYTYPAGMGWGTLALIETIGAFVLAVSILLFLINVWISLRRGQPAGNNPWGAGTLEWATTSPPPPYNFRVQPTVTSRHALWDAAWPEAELGGEDPTDPQARQTLQSSTLEGLPQRPLAVAKDSTVPFWLALALSAVFVGLLLALPWLIAAGLVASLIAVIAWVRPVREVAS